MNVIRKLLVVVLVLFFSITNILAQEQTAEFPVLKGPYFGQKIPQAEPLLFAPGIISLEGVMVHDTPVFSTDGKEIYWGEFSTNPNHTSIKYSKLVNNIWIRPALVPFSSLNSYGDGCPFIMPGGEILYFSSFRALAKGGESGRERIWYVKRKENGWGEPKPAEQVVNTMDLHWQTSISANRNLFFSTEQGIMRSRFINGKYLLYLSWQKERPGVYWFPAHFIEELKPKEVK